MKRTTKRVREYRDEFRKNPAYASVERAVTAAHPSLDEAKELYLYALLPVLTEFVGWVLRQAEAAGKKRLYFLARDGYQMYLAAKSLSHAWGMEMDCRYLSVSRFALRVPEYHLLGDACLERICTGGIDVTFEKICKRAALTDEETAVVAKECGRETELKRILNYREVLQLKDVLRACPTLLETVKRRSEEAYPNAIGYLEQEGLFEDVPYAVVDSGWVGTLQLTLERLLQSKDPQRTVEGYYFGTYEYPHGCDRKRFHPFYFSPTDGLRRKVYFSNCLFEALFSAPEGMTLRYERVDGRYVPVTDLKENPNVEQLRRHLALLHTFLEAYPPSSPPAGDARAVWRVLHRLMGNPTEEEVAAFGDTLFSDDVLEGHLQKVAAELSTEEIKRQRFFTKLKIMTGLKKETLRESAWIEGSIVRNGVQIGKNLFHAHFYKYFIYVRKRLRQGGTH